MGCKGHRANPSFGVGEPALDILEPTPVAPKRERGNTHHRDLCLRAARWLRQRGRFQPPACPYVAVELVTANPECPDVFGWNYWATVLIEVKVSRADFLADAKKPFRQNPADGAGAFRYYCCPEGLIHGSEVPENWGLLWECDGKIEPIKPAASQPSNAQSEIAILASIMRREGVSPRIFDYREKTH